MKEKVLVISNKFLNFEPGQSPIGRPDDWKEYFEQQSFYMYRDQAETDLDFRQIIPYVLVKNSKNEYLTYRRTSHGGEERLHHKLSIGVGGHVNFGDARKNPVLEGLYREMKEEIGLTQDQYSWEWIGYLMLSKTEVDKVHLGLIFEVLCDTIGDVENCLEIVGWFSKEELKTMQQSNEFESWSEAIINGQISGIF